MKTETATVVSEKFEREECTRCGGAGEYSYCQAYGTKCFQCNGKRFALTVRGKAANAYCKTLRAKKAKDVQVGDMVRIATGKGVRVSTVVAVEAVSLKWREQRDGVWHDCTAERINIRTAIAVLGVEPDSEVSMQLPPEQMEQTLATALAYQATLTKAGKPRANLKK